MTNPTRDEIIATLKALPGVEEAQGGGTVRSFRRPGSYSHYAHVSKSGRIYVSTGELNATLAEAVAALTPPDDGLPTFDWVAGLKGARTDGGDHVYFSREPFSDSEVSFYFENGKLHSAWVHCVRLATPKTRAEVLATLKVCGAEHSDEQK